jgi:hypothetical protein
LNNRLDGYEIKSDRDRLGRLERQFTQYASICDRLTVVAAERHEDKLMSLLPEWCGVIIALHDGSLTRLVSRRAPAVNPQWDVVALLYLLWQDETYELARHCGMRVPRGMAKGLVHASLARRVAHETLRIETLKRLSNRRRHLTGRLSHHRSPGS